MTPFTRRIYALVSTIPFGQVSSYGEVAAMAGRPGAPRAVGSALASIPDDLDLPWWRVVNSSGKISTSPIHHTAQIQRALLEDEGVHFSTGGRIDWDLFGWTADGRSLESEPDESTA